MANMKTLKREDTTLTDLTEMSDSMHSISTQDSSESRGRSVMFSVVSVREYNRVVGDHPDTKFGPPLSIGWEYAENEAVDIDSYEEHRDLKGVSKLSSLSRKKILRDEFGIPDREIAESEKEVQKILKQRRSTNSQSKQSEKMESFRQSMRRKMKRTFSREKLLDSMSKGMVFPVMVQ